MMHKFSFAVCTSALLTTLVLSGCGSSPMGSSLAGNNNSSQSGTPPTVSAVGVQVNGAAANRKQEVQFSEAMDPSTINAQSFQITDSSGKQAQGTVTYDPDYNIASFQPSPALQAGATYTGTITTAAVSAGGVHLANPYTFEFTTRATTDTSPITVAAVSPNVNATCVSATSAITVTFNESPDASTVTPGNFMVSGPSGAISVKISMDVTNTAVVLTPTSALPSGKITVTISNVADLAGVKMTAPYTWSFSTACNGGGGGGGASGNEYLYVPSGVAAGTPEFYAYVIDSATGNLTPVPGMPFQASVGTTPTPCGGPTCGTMDALADPVGRFLFYDFDQNQHGVGTMKVDPATGALTNDDFLTVTPNNTTVPRLVNISADPQGRFIFGTGTESSPAPSGSDWLSSIVVGSNGTLSLAAGSPFELPEGNNDNAPAAPAVTNEFVFVADPAFYSQASQQPSDMFGFSIDQTSGALSAVSHIQDGLSAGEQVVTPSGKFLYSETHSIQSNGFQGPRELAGFQVNSDGSFTPISQAPLQLPSNNYGIFPTLTMSPNGNFLYVSSMYTVSTAGPPPVTTTTIEIQAYVIDQNTGALTKTGDYTWDATRANHPFGPLVIDPAVKYVYLSEATSGTAATLVGMKVDPTTGTLSPISGVQTWPVVPVQSGRLTIVRPQ